MTSVDETRPPEAAPTGPTAPAAPVGRDPTTTWSGRVDRLAVGERPTEAMNLNVAGRRLVGPVQGFGQLWQKVYRIRLDGADATAQDVVRVWKDEFATFWPLCRASSSYTAAQEPMSLHPILAGRTRTRCRAPGRVAGSITA